MSEREREVRRRRTRLDQDPGDLVGRSEGSWLTKLEERTLGVLALGEEARLPKHGIGGGRLPGADLQSRVAMPLECLVVEFLDEPATMDDADPRGEAIDLGEDVARHEHRLAAS